jgi:hypothetical protein
MRKFICVACVALLFCRVELWRHYHFDSGVDGIWLSLRWPAEVCDNCRHDGHDKVGAYDIGVYWCYGLNVEIGSDIRGVFNSKYNTR